MYKYLQHLTKLMFSNLILGKKIRNFDKTLYYEVSQHLTFLFMKKIDYEKNVWANIIKFIKSGDLIFDIGGNIGQYALRFSEAVTNKGKVITFEPDLKNYAFLKFNIDINVTNNILPVNVGLSNREGEAVFYRDITTGGRLGSFIKSTDLSDKSEIVKITTLDKLIDQYGIPNFIKVDVEGFEVECLKGLSIYNKKSKYLIEVRNSTKREIFDIFNKNNFSCFIVDGLTLQKVKKSEDIPGFANLLFIYE